MALSSPATEKQKTPVARTFSQMGGAGLEPAATCVYSGGGALRQVALRCVEAKIGCGERGHAALYFARRLTSC